MPAIEVLVTFDFEEWGGRYNIYKADLYTKTKRIVDSLLERRIPATFFLDAETVLNYPEAAKLLTNEAFELALHSDRHWGVKDWYLPSLDFSIQSPKIQMERIKSALSMIRRVIPNFDPQGFRAPGLRWNEALYTSLSRLNFLYDSSQQTRFVFTPYIKDGVVVLPVNCGDYDSACYKQKPQYVINSWIDNFRRAYKAVSKNMDSYFLLLAHPSVCGKYKYIGMLKSMLNYIRYFDVTYLTCSEAASKFLRKKGDQTISSTIEKSWIDKDGKEKANERLLIHKKPMQQKRTSISVHKFLSRTAEDLHSKEVG